MNLVSKWRVAAAGALLTAASLMLSGCIVSPGKFTSTLDLRRDGAFTFTYEGQIYLLALSRLAEMANNADASGGEFVEQPCYDEEEEFEERPCTAEEVAEQRRAWEGEAAAKKAKSERETEAMRAMLGGIDPADPEAAEELAERLRRQKGWQRVDYRGDGLFEVSFAISSQMSHDFAFPTFERFPMSNAFVVANPRIGNTVRIDAPGFATQGNGNPMQGMLTGMAGMFSALDTTDEPNEMPMPEMEGTFRIVTDGRILANNTDEGPQPDPAGQALEWKINKRTQSAPMALIQLGS